jgi:hypothetical protein
MYPFCGQVCFTSLSILCSSGLYNFIHFVFICALPVYPLCSKKALTVYPFCVQVCFTSLSNLCSSVLYQFIHFVFKCALPVYPLCYEANRSRNSIWPTRVDSASKPGKNDVVVTDKKLFIN